MIYIYEVIANKLTCDGFHAGSEILKRFTNRSDAIHYKEDWEEVWQEHTDNHDNVSPCWYDYEKDLIIKRVRVETEYDGNGI